jgi:sugar phosphate isomerase/epimerase
MTMQNVLFTKLFRGETTEAMAETTANLGFDGIDLLIRPGHQVEPESPGGIQGAINTIQAAGLSVPMATTDLTDPTKLPTEALLNACAEAGIKVVRLGYWKYDPATRYAAILETARYQLDQLAEIAQRTGIQLAIQIHGGTIHASGAQTAVLLAGHDPQVLGAYPDPGNQVVQDGREDWRFTFDVLKPWLCCVGVKNGGWFAGELAENGQRHWHSDWLGIPDGMVPWADIITYLTETGFDGELTFHSHYEVPLPQVLDQTRVDLNFVKRLVETRMAVLA